MAVIQHAFPSILNGLMFEGDLPDETTVRAAVGHTFSTVLDSIVARTSYMELSKVIYMRKYIPSIT